MSENHNKKIEDDTKAYKFKGKAIDFLKEAIDTIVFVIVMVIVIRFFIGEIRWIPSASMHPTLIEGDRLFVNRYSRFNTLPERGDILVFYPPQEQLENNIWAVFSRLTGFFCRDIAYIKRVVGIPGDRINVKTDKAGNTFLWVNGRKLYEPYVKDIHDENYKCNEDTKYCLEVIVPENSYFMMGDNRGNSQDSRYWGVLPKDRIIGRATFIFWPLNRIQLLTDTEYTWGAYQHPDKKSIPQN